MYKFSVYTLGCGSAKPTVRHQPSCTVVNHRDNLYMIDCGEGSQRAFQFTHLKLTRLNHIFLTHLHGDHVLGLPGLLSTLALSGVGGKITVHTFADGEKILRQILDFFGKDLTFNLEFDIIEPKDTLILETPSLTVRTVKLHHRSPAVGYIFEEKPGLRHIRRDMIDFHRVPVSKIRDIKEGADFVKPDGSVIANEILTTDADPTLSYAHISDTIYMPELAEKIGPVDLLFHETTYLERHAAEAKTRFHSTACQAAMVARDAGAKVLLTGHYSSRYKDEDEFRREAETIFPRVILNKEGLVTDITSL